MKKITTGILILASALLLLAGCGKGSAKQSDNKKVKLGVVGSDTRTWDFVKEKLAKDGIDLEIVEFTDYNQPNAALNDKEIDLNSFQHQIFLDNYNNEHGTKLTSIGNTVNSPLGIYSEKIKSVDELKDGDEISIPNDPTNGGRALILLQKAGLIKVNAAKNNLPTVEDITENKKQLKITELDAAQTARSLQDVAAAIINGGMAIDAGYSPKQDAIFFEPVDDESRPYVNIIVARPEDTDNQTYQKIVAAYQQDDVKDFILETYKEAYQPAWETFGKK
ncbi:MetQ/NlpA family ABC transporter substrate-binding protein [Vagococcus acidifermentans]|uniref:Lipoprotein n=1 Tax=Vagococcus acidifermentans TaxID=564710 RepID=A0A430AQE1_9ENTE|nr:MetQ/NlpA family ABC transporter substrate-binding protein [Vagococcus acidifermentans]RSU10117.1 methionine ABC transporter substrate-binding protein [Vagococcus acidifermentans]